MQKVFSEYMRGKVRKKRIELYGGPKSDEQEGEIKRRTAYHETGHIVANHYTGGNPVEMVTLDPVGQARFPLLNPFRAMIEFEEAVSTDGYVIRKEAKPVFSRTEKELFSKIVTFYGGLAAEVSQFGTHQGTEGDVIGAARLAKELVFRLEYPDKVEKICENTMSFLEAGRTHSFDIIRVYSDMGASYAHEFWKASKRKKIPPDILVQRVKSILSFAEEEAGKIVKEHMPEVEKIAQALLDRDTLTGKEIYEIAGWKEQESPTNGLS